MEMCCSSGPGRQDAKPALQPLWRLHNKVNPTHKLVLHCKVEWSGRMIIWISTVNVEKTKVALWSLQTCQVEVQSKMS